MRRLKLKYQQKIVKNYTPQNATLLHSRLGFSFVDDWDVVGRLHIHVHLDILQVSFKRLYTSDREPRTLQDTR